MWKIRSGTLVQNLGLIHSSAEEIERANRRVVLLDREMYTLAACGQYCLRGLKLLEYVGAGLKTKLLAFSLRNVMVRRDGESTMLVWRADLSPPLFNWDGGGGKGLETLASIPCALQEFE